LTIGQPERLRGPLHANTQGEKDTRQEIVTDVRSTDGLDKEDAVPADRATNPPDEEAKTVAPRQTPIPK